MFLVGFLPCDSMCIDITIVGRLHSITSTVSAILIPIAIMVFAYPLLKIYGKNWGYFSFYIELASILAGPLMFIEVLSNYTGLIQRIGIGLSLLWIFLVSIKIYFK